MHRFASFLRLGMVTALLAGIFAQPQTVHAASLPAEINKQFTPLQIDAGGVSVLRISIFNPNTFPLFNVAFIDDLARVQPGLYVANPAGVVNTCGGTVTAVPGATTVSLSGGAVPAQVGPTPGQCYIEVNISSVTAGNLINTIPAHNPPADIGLTADGIDNGTPVVITNTSPASATITVVAVSPPSLSKTFAPNTIFVGQTSQLTIRLNNNDADTNLTGVSYTDTLPGGLVIASPSGLSVANCGAGATVTAPANGTAVSLSNGIVTPSQDCVISVNVTGSFGQYTNTIPAGPGGPGSIRTNQGVTNTSPASANLNIQPVGITKAFSPSTIVAGGTSTLTITLQNPTGSPYTGVSVTDDLPAGITVANAPSTTCGGGAVSGNVGDTSVQLTSGTIPASATPPTPVGSCIITVPVQASLAVSGSRTNTIPANALTADQPGVTNYLPASANIAVNPALTGTKTYSPTIIPLNGISTVTITLTNNSAAPLTNLSFTDILPTNLEVSGVPASPQCGGTVTNTLTSVTLTGGSLAAAPGPGNTCTISFDVTSDDPGSGTTYENSIPIGNITTDEGVGNNSSITTGADLTVVNATTLPVNVAKSFTPATVTPAQASRVRITLTAPADIGVSGISITDTLPAGVVVATPNPPSIPNPTESCPGGTLTAVPGTDTITFTNLATNTLAAGASCNIDVYVVAAEAGSFDNLIPANSVITSQGRTNEFDSNTANLRVTSMSMSKAFYPTAVQANGLSTLTITLQNTSPSDLINVTMTDNLPGSVTNGMVVAPTPNAITTCGAGTVTANPGAQVIQLTGGTIPAQVGGVPGICTITVDVQGRDSSPTSPSAQTNTIPVANVTGTVANTGVTIGPFAQAQASLNIRNLSIGVVKGFDPVLVYGGATSTMTVQLINPESVALTGIAFTDNMALLQPGIVLANPVMFNTGTCGGALTGSPGDSSFSFSGGTLLPNSSCTLTLRVIMNVNGNRTNRIPAGAVTTFNGVSSTQPTEASLTNLPGVSVNKVFNPNPIQVNETTVLTLTITNTSDIPVVSMGLTDNLPGDLPAGLFVANPANLTNTCNGTATANPGDQVIQLSGGSLAGNSSCSISVDVTTSEPGAYVNTIPAGGLITNDPNVTNNNPATDTLRVGDLFSLGNRVWFDTNNNSQIDLGESGADGVTVELFAADPGGAPTGPALAAQVTAGGGYYRFDDLAPGDYVVVVPASQFASGGPLAGYQSSGTTIDASGAISESPAPDPDNDTDNEDNGARRSGGAVISGAVTLGPNADEPTDDADAPAMNPAGEAPNDRSNRTVDFGFYRQELGNLVFVDVNGNGAYNAASDALVQGAVVRLYSSNGAEINVGADGIWGTVDDAPGGVTTGADGLYLFSGLPQGDYVIRVTPPAGFTSTVDTANAGDTNNPNNNVDNNDNGVGVAGGTVSSNLVTLTPGSAGAANNNAVSNATGVTYNPTLDFGFVPLYSLGNRVWFDTDNNSLINGSEVGVDGVTVELYLASDLTIPLAADVTANGGYYRFDDLAPGDYVVVIPSSQFASGGPLAGYYSSGTTIDSSGAISESPAPDPDGNSDSDDNGALQTGGAFNGAVIAGAVTLGPGVVEPTDDSDADPTNPAGEAPNGQSNRSVDFGFYRTELGNLVFVDVNGNGAYDSGTDAPLPGASVQLFSSNGAEINVGPDGILGTADDAPGGVTTGAGGTYLFSGLPQGSYSVRVTPPAGYVSAVDTANTLDTTDPNTNVDHNDNGVGTAGGTVSSNVVALTPGSSGALNNNAIRYNTGVTHDPTLDFGFQGGSGANFGSAKTLSASNQTFTTNPNVAIGEIVEYTVTVNVPPGIFANSQLVDSMDRGLSFVTCSSVTESDPALTTDLPGSFTQACSTPTVDDSGGSTTVDVGRRVTFDLGTVTNTSGADQTLRFVYTAVVLDSAANISGATLDNSAVWSSDAGTQPASSATVLIAEPDLSITKTADAELVSVGSLITITLNIRHTAESEVNAYDVVVTDPLPAELELVAGTLECSSGAQDANLCAYDAGARTINAVWDAFVLGGGDGGVTFQVRVSSISSNGVSNVANVAWTSLPGDVSQPQNNNVFSTERDYDPASQVDVYGRSDTLVLGVFRNAPATGFAPNVVTDISNLPKETYAQTGGLTVDIPSLGISIPIVGVPLKAGEWNVSWLENQAGWLEGSAFPSWSGNSVLTGHVYLSNGLPGPFVNLGRLKYGDRIIVRAYGQTFIYEVRANVVVAPNDASIFRHEEKSWLTLVTCREYDEKANSYGKRVVVRAVLVSVERR
ncbi:MAG: sortase [Anaerolineales bacterium]|nr:sortase [Anaerolineales bacterium]